MKIVLEIAFDGSEFHGWQKQLNAHTVQDEIEQKLNILFNKRILTTGCGRTDTGVHAKQFFLDFELSEDDPIYCLQKLNLLLNQHISILNIYTAQANFNSRFDAIERTYHYYFHQHKNPFLRFYSLLIFKKLDWDLMNKACEVLKSFTDFECFCKSNSSNSTYTCIINKAHFYEINDQVVFEISANRFLRNMVRAIVGTLVDIGLHKINLQEFRTILESKNRNNAGQSMPAHALFLTDIKYPKDSLNRYEFAK